MDEINPMDSELEDAFAEEDPELDLQQGEEPKEEGFAIGTVVFPVVKEKDYIDSNAILINHADTYVGNHIGYYLSTRRVGGNEYGGEEEEAEEEEEPLDLSLNKDDYNPKNWKLLGTLKNPRSPDPKFLWATVVYDDFEAYLKELLKCSVIIYDVTHDASQERINEIRRVCDALREKVPIFKKKRIFILISSLHSWSHTTKPKHDPEYILGETDYRRRRTKPLYRELQLLERYVVASGKMTRGMLKAYVIGAGAIYGGEENPLHTWFKSAWHNAKYLPIYGSGKNFLPTIYIQDLASIVENVINFTPRNQRYIIAVDPVLSQQDQIVKAISKEIGSGKVKNVLEEDVYLNRDLSTFQADQILLDLPIQSTFCKENFDIEWTAEAGMPSIIKRLVAEFRVTRGLEPLRLIINGPPGVGKSTVARQLADMYRFHHFDMKTMIESTLELLRTTAGEADDADDASAENDDELLEKRKIASAKAKALLSEIDPVLSSGNELDMESIVKLYRYRLKTNEVQNQGYILDGFPESYEQAKALFALSETDVYEEEDFGEDGKDSLDRMLLPDHIVYFEAPDEFIKDRLLKIPIEQLKEEHYEFNFPQLLEDYNRRQENFDKTCIAYLHEQEIMYEPIDISTDTSEMMSATATKISHSLGKPRNYGLSFDEEVALKNSQRTERAELDKRMKEDVNLTKTKVLEARRNHIEQWMEKLEKTKREEFEREEAAMVPLRHYLMAHVVPTLTKGLIDITRTRPEDPIDYLAEFLFQNNPGGINPCGDNLFFQ